MDIILYNIEKKGENTIKLTLVHNKTHLNHYFYEVEKTILKIIKNNRTHNFGNTELYKSISYPLNQFMHRTQKNEYEIINKKFEKQLGTRHLGKIIFYEGNVFQKNISDKIGNTKKFTFIDFTVNLYPEHRNIPKLKELRYENPYFRNAIFEELRKHIKNADEIGYRLVA